MAPGSQSHLSDSVVNSTEMHTHRSSVETIVFLGHVGKECLKSSVDHEGKEAQPSKGVSQKKPEQRPCKLTPVRYTQLVSMQPPHLPI